MSKQRETFTCEQCHQTFPTVPGWTDDDAEAEYQQEFPIEANAPGAQRAIICHECYLELKARLDAVPEHKTPRPS